MPKSENKKIDLVTRARRRDRDFQTVGLYAVYSIEGDAINFSVHSADGVKSLLGEGDAFIIHDHIYLRFIANQEDEQYKYIGTALIETLLSIIIANKLNKEIKLVSFDFSQGFFKRFGFRTDSTIQKQKLSSSTAEHLMISAAVTQALYDSLTKKRHTPRQGPCSFFCSAIKNCAEGIYQKAVNYLNP
jgi:N-acetylglutamate synthase-like GNAT family acetyltransferase